MDLTAASMPKGNTQGSIAHNGGTFNEIRLNLGHNNTLKGRSVTCL